GDVGRADRGDIKSSANVSPLTIHYSLLIIHLIRIWEPQGLHKSLFVATRYYDETEKNTYN
ncbi:MAG: hypothetical protein IJI67_03520, partial [Clostridia bacterium]|nr:hypothetical protein [Clostridia bacterium]